eukprot:TRINITY_DN28206_c0_g1_i2.p1 TRINITY_DN28206_c0_g1~~TRINITY_DN28206_c0_g1_i2.p1  ORF type:complete len:274 (+),score=69.81 TRINITY_DN28206_c0_g1_i2:154-975(+)
MLRSLVGSEMCIRDSVETADFAGMELSRSAVFGRYGGGDELAISPPWCLIELAQQSVGSAVRDEVYRLLETGYLGYAALSEMYGVEPAQVPGVEELEWSVKLSVGGVPEGENRFNVLLSGWLYPQGTAGCAPADGSMPSKFPLVGMIRGHGWECGRSEDAATLGDGVLKPAHHDVHDWCCLTAQMAEFSVLDPQAGAVGMLCSVDLAARRVEIMIAVIGPSGLECRDQAESGLEALVGSFSLGSVGSTLVEAGIPEQLGRYAQELLFMAISDS